MEFSPGPLCGPDVFLLLECRRDINLLGGICGFKIALSSMWLLKFKLAEMKNSFSQACSTFRVLRGPTQLSVRAAQVQSCSLPADAPLGQRWLGQARSRESRCRGGQRGGGRTGRSGAEAWQGLPAQGGPGPLRRARGGPPGPLLTRPSPPSSLLQRAEDQVPHLSHPQAGGCETERGGHHRQRAEAGPRAGSGLLPELGGGRQHLSEFLRMTWGVPGWGRCASTGEGERAGFQSLPAPGELMLEQRRKQRPGRVPPTACEELL